MVHFSGPPMLSLLRYFLSAVILELLGMDIAVHLLYESWSSLCCRSLWKPALTPWRNPHSTAVLWKKTQTKLGSFLALVSEDASGGNHFRTLFLGMVSGGLWVPQSCGSAWWGPGFLDLLNEEQPDKNRTWTVTSLLLLLNMIIGVNIFSIDVGVWCGKLMKLISSRWSIFYFLPLCLLGSEMY